MNQPDRHGSLPDRGATGGADRLRPVVLGIAVVALLFGILAVVRGSDEGEERSVRSSPNGADQRGPKDAGRRSSPPTTAGPTSSSSAPSTSAPSTSAPSTATTAPEAGSGEPELTLPAADPTAPPQAPFGVFTGGKLYLRGSVPSVDIAQRYVRKATAILGAANVVVQATLDPRAPAGPARVIVEEQFTFPVDSTTYDPKFDRLLAVGAVALQKIPESTLVIVGHTDSSGSADYNQQLSLRRAQIIVDYMVSKGIPADRIKAIGRGEAEPIADNGTPEGRARNRRIEGILEGIMP